MGICNLRHLAGELALRKTVFERYFENLSEVEGLTLLKVHDGIRQNYAYFPVLVEKERFGMDRDGLCAKLADEDIYARKYFYPLVSENKEFEKDMTGNAPMAKYYSRSVVCLPMYAHLALADVDRICEIIKR